MSEDLKMMFGLVKPKYMIEHNIGDFLYLKTDYDQHKRIVTGISIRENGVMYALSQGTNESYHYAFEISKEKDILITSTN